MLSVSGRIGNWTVLDVNAGFFNRPHFDSRQYLLLVCLNRYLVDERLHNGLVFNRIEANVRLLD
jgi:hypothetical protein